MKWENEDMEPEVKTVLLVDKYNTQAGDRLSKGAVCDLPHKEAENAIGRGKAVETVPSDPERAKAWLADLTRKAMERAEHYNDTYRNHYLNDFRRFAEWCKGEGLQPLPTTSEDLVRYLLHRAMGGAAIATLRRDCNGIAAIHGMTNHPPVAWFLSQTVWRDYTNALSLAAISLTRDRRGSANTERAKIERAYEMFGQTGVVIFPVRDAA